MRNNFKTLKRGFTLVELMVAMTITTILVLIIVGLTHRGIDVWRSVVTDVRATSKAREALNTMVSDLESIQLRAGNNYEWLIAEKDRELNSRRRGNRGTQMTMGPSGLEFTNASRLIFFTSAVDRTSAVRSDEAGTAQLDNLSRKQTAGDINCVGYKLEYKDQILNIEADKDSMGFPVYALYRNIVPAYKTKEDLLTREDLFEAYRRYTADETRSVTFLVENIIEMTYVFEVDYSTRGGTGANENSNQLAYRKIEYVPVVTTDEANSSNTYRRVSIYGDRLRVERQGTSDQQMTYGNIVGLSISMTVVSDEGMAIVDAVRRGNRPAPKIEDFIQRYTKQFTQRVPIPKPN